MLKQYSYSARSTTIFTARNEVWGKVIFSQACVILFTGGGGGLRAWAPGTRHPPGVQHTGRYGQRAGGMHPTGMQFLSLSQFYSPPRMSLF